MTTAMGFNFQFAFLCASLMYFVNADDFKTAQVSSRIQYRSVRRDMNTSIATKTVPAKLLAQCMAKCNADQSTSLYFVEAAMMCQCNNERDVSTEDDPNKPEIVYGESSQKTEILQYKEFTKWNVIPRKEDCLALHEAGFSQDGVYTIQPTGQEPVDTWCDMQNGGWTVFQRRLDGSEDFYRGWSDYVTGFGNRTGEYWLGLDNLHALTTQPSELYLYAEAFEGMNPQSAYGRYSAVTLDGPLQYKLNVDGFTGSCPDPILATFAGNSRSFSTFDNDQDRSKSLNCAVSCHGAWWYGRCQAVNFNGYYYGGNHTSYGDGVNWAGCWGNHYSVMKTVMKVLRTNDNVIELP